MFVGTICGLATTRDGVHYGYFKEDMNQDTTPSAVRRSQNVRYGVVQLSHSQYRRLKPDADGNDQLWGNQRATVNLANRPVFKPSRAVKTIALTIGRDDRAGKRFGTFNLHGQVSLKTVVGQTKENAGSWLYFGKDGDNRAWMRAEETYIEEPNRIWVGKEILKKTIEPQRINKRNVDTVMHEYSFDSVVG